MSRDSPTSRRDKIFVSEEPVCLKTSVLRVLFVEQLDPDHQYVNVMIMDSFLIESIRVHLRHMSGV